MQKRMIENWLLTACDPSTWPSRPDMDFTVESIEAILSVAKQHAVLGSVLKSFKTWDIVSLIRSESDRLDARNVIHQYSDLHFRNVGLTLGLRQVANDLLLTLTNSGIPCCVLKGEDFAKRLYHDLSLRPYRDIDLLVPRQSFADANAILQSRGFVADLPSRKYAAEDYGQISYFSSGPERWSVELHWNLINSPAQRRMCSLDWNDLEFLSGRGPRGEHLLTPTSLLILASVHACIGHRFDSLQQLCDIRQICRGTSGPLDVERLYIICQKSNCITPVKWSLDLLVDVLQCTNAAELSNSCQFAIASKRRFGNIGRNTVLNPTSLTSRIQRSIARLRLASAA